MAHRLKIYLADLFHDYRPNHICLPLGVGFVGEYLKKVFTTDVDVHLFKSPMNLFESIRQDPPHILGLSNYSWNLEINRLIEKRVTAEFPKTIIVGGGPHIRLDNEGIMSHLRDHSDIDYFVMLAGEHHMANLVGMMLSKGKPVGPQECDQNIEGVAFVKDNQLVYAPHTPKKKEFDEVPSPYLSGLLDPFLENPQYLPLLETNRGCPFACTFCAWGIAELNSTYYFDLDRIREEIDYVAERSKAVVWYLTDANFGMIPRDIQIGEALREAASKNPYLKITSVNWAKNTKHTAEIAKVMKGLCDPLIAVQTTDPDVLKNIKRSNIRMTTITNLTEVWKKDNIKMTTDVLAGLPGETYVSHLKTLEDVFELGFNSFNVGPIRMLPGSEMESEEHRTKFGLKTKYRLIAGFLGIYDNEPVCEYEESVVETNTMSREDMYNLRVLHFFIWVLWNSNIAQPLLRYMLKVEKINPLRSIGSLLEGDLSEDLKEFIETYKQEARSEWFDSAEELIANFKKDYKNHLDGEYLKLNLKYLAKIFLNRPIIQSMLDVIVKKSKKPVANDLARFCMERMIKVTELVKDKEIACSKDLTEALSLAYPDNGDIKKSSESIKLSMSDKLYNAISNELSRFDFDKNPLRAVTVMLQTLGTKLSYDFNSNAPSKSAEDDEFMEKIIEERRQASFPSS